jgi:2-C-methyl-D-erythritol 4-phosphate cytidylyltransferase
MNRHWVVVPAAGSGLRIGSAVPKQYLPLLGKPVIVHTLERLASHPQTAGIVVAIAASDLYWPSLDLGLAKRIEVVEGGTERCYSVLNALQRLSELAYSDDWVLVHDAARPCVRVTDIDRLIQALSRHPVGGLLAIPVADTLKRADATGNVIETVSREGLWRAGTPQMFRLGPLSQALQSAVERGLTVTDEASALELAGDRPQLVEGHQDNIKITQPEDLRMAELYLKQQEWAA